MTGGPWAELFGVLMAGALLGLTTGAILCSVLCR